MRLREGDPVQVAYDGKRPRRGHILGFSPREEWSGSGMGRRSFRSHWVMVTFPDGSVDTVPPTRVTSETRPKQHNTAEETTLG